MRFRGQGRPKRFAPLPQIRSLMPLSLKKQTRRFVRHPTLDPYASPIVLFFLNVCALIGE